MVRNILFFLIIISQVASSQPNQKTYSKPYAFVDSILKKDSYAVEILDFEYPKDIQEISLKFQKNMTEKKQWYEQYFSKYYKAGEGLPYDENFGITKYEYQKIKDMQKTPPSVVVKNKSEIKANRDSDILSFKAIDQNTSFFESVRIDFKKERIFFISDTIPYSNEINATSTPFGQWHGYSWKKEISNLGEKDDLKMDSLVSKIVEISFGKVQASNKILFRLKYKEVDRGKIKANFDVACYIN